MIKKFFITLLATTTFLVSCSSDDDSKELSIEQRDSLDDEAIQEFLANYYFNPRNGKLTPFDAITGNEDDNYTPLKDLAIKDEKGYYYAFRPGVEANGNSVISSDKSKILISYDAYSFVSTNDKENYKYRYGSISSFSNTINANSGSGVYDPFFYYANLTEAEIKNGVKRENVEIINFAEALKKFKATNTKATDQYDFQGVIIIPSRLAFSRNKVYTSSSLSDRFYRDYNFIFSFELHDVSDR